MGRRQLYRSKYSGKQVDENIDKMLDLSKKVDKMNVCLTKAEYDKLKEEGKIDNDTTYLIEEE